MTLTDDGQYLINGVTYPRVSTILDVISKPGLDAWKRKVGFDVADQIVETAAALGTEVHAACENVSLRKPSEGSDEVAPYVEAFRRWMNRYVRTVVKTEYIVHSKVLGYAGTADLIAVLKDGRTAVIDIKTSRWLSPTYRLQLAAYRYALKDMDADCDCRIIAWLSSRKPGTAMYVEYDYDSKDEYAWISALDLYEWQKAHENDWKKNG